MSDGAEQLAETVALVTAATLAHARALGSLLDVVEELAGGLAAGQEVEREWTDVVYATFQLHRRELRGEPVVWPAREGES